MRAIPWQRFDAGAPASLETLRIHAVHIRRIELDGIIVGVIDHRGMIATVSARTSAIVGWIVGCGGVLDRALHANSWFLLASPGGFEPRRGYREISGLQ